MILKSNKKPIITATRTAFGKLNPDCLIQILSFLPKSQLLKLKVLNSSYRRLIQTTTQFYTHMKFFCDIFDPHSSLQFNTFASVAQHVRGLSIDSLGIIATEGICDDLEINYDDLDLILQDMPKLKSFHYDAIIDNDNHNDLDHILFKSVSLNCSHLIDLSLKTHNILVSDFTLILSNLPMLKLVEFTDFSDRLLPSFYPLKQHLIRIGRIRLHMQYCKQGDNLVASDFIGMTCVNLTISLFNYSYWFDGDACILRNEGDIIAEIDEIKALPNVKVVEEEKISCEE